MKKIQQPDWQLDANKYHLDAEESEILTWIEDGFSKGKLWIEDKKTFTQAARNTLKKRAINIRLSEMDVRQIKSIALEEGIPYQTFISSVLHKLVNKRLISK